MYLYVYVYTWGAEGSAPRATWSMLAERRARRARARRSTAWYAPARMVSTTASASSCTCIQPSRAIYSSSTESHLFVIDREPSIRHRSRAIYRGTSLIRNSPPTRTTTGPRGWAVSYERVTPVLPRVASPHWNNSLIAGLGPTHLSHRIYL